ncbi:Regenerating islet-derived protein 4 [Cricetulus griseus]|uniref:Regenerating islet-derived protein 4 n=1 Tax=Cricetulus griseus TaxID=10029 RepID=G3HP77_CRIGR|nr:Regenerating islet-derived protein 4 [Cricetulus griseus]
MENWSHAELECQSYGNGSHLASVLNEKEASVISNYIFGYQRNLPVWIGLHDPQKNQLWRWIDGSTQLYRPWNRRTKSEGRHCAALNPKDSKFLVSLPSLQATAPSFSKSKRGTLVHLPNTPFIQQHHLTGQWSRHTVENLQLSVPTLQSLPN